MKNTTVFATLLALAPALLAGLPISAQAAECPGEWDGFVIASIRADTWCSASPSTPEIDQICAEKIADYDNAWSSYANCMALDTPPPTRP